MDKRSYIVRGGALLAALALASCEQPSEVPVQTDPATGEQVQEFRLLSVSGLADTPYLVGYLGYVPDYSRFLSKGKRPVYRNIVLIDRETGDSASLLPDNSRNVEELYFVPAQEGPLEAWGGYRSERDRPLPSPPVYFAVQSSSMNGDVERNELAIGTIADLKAKTVLTGFAKIQRYAMLDGNRLSLIIAFEDRDEMQTIDLATGQVVFTSEIDPATPSP